MQPQKEEAQERELLGFDTDLNVCHSTPQANAAQGFEWTLTASAASVVAFKAPPPPPLPMSEEQIAARRIAALAQAEHLKLIHQPGKDVPLSHDELQDIRGLFTNIVNPLSTPKDRADAILQACPEPGMRLPMRRKGWKPAHMAVMMVDIDDGNLPIERAQQLTSEFFGPETIATVYSSAGSMESDQRWRIAIPLARPTEAATWLQGMKAFAAFAQERGVKVDKATFTKTQPIFLPNVPHKILNKDGSFKAHGRYDNGAPIFYQQVNLGHRLVDLTAIPCPAGAQAMAAQARRDAEELQRQQERKAQAEIKFAQREAERARLMAEGKETRTPIELFKDLHDTSDLMLKFGFIEDAHKPGHFHHPELQTTGSYATKVTEDGHWFTKSSTLREKGLGVPSATGETNHGDQFDLVQYFEFGNDNRAAVRGVAQALGLVTVHPAAQASEDAFTAIPRPEGNVIPFPGVPDAPVKPMRYLNQIVSIKDSLDLPVTRWMIKDVLPCAGTCAVYGQTRAGKTYVVIDLAMHLLTKSKTEWFGRRIRNRPSAVCYFAMEDIVGVRGRVRAWAEDHGCDLPDNFHIFDGNDFNLMNSLDVEDIAQAILKVTGEGALVIVDTQIKAAAGADEQSSRDTSLMYKNLDRIAGIVKGVAMPVAHAGKDVSLGMRGSSAQTAAADMSIVVKRTGNVSSWAVDKNKSGPEGETGHFGLRMWDLGVDKQGDEMSAYVLVPKDSAAVGKEKLSPSAQVVLTTLEKLIGDSDGSPVPDSVLRDAVYEVFKEADPKGKQDTRKKNYGNGLGVLTKANMVLESRGGYVLGFYNDDAQDHMQKLTGIPNEDTS